MDTSQYVISKNLLRKNSNRVLILGSRSIGCELTENKYEKQIKCFYLLYIMFIIHNL